MAVKASNVETIIARKDDAVDIILGINQGYGWDVCVDAVGMEANQNLFSESKNLIQGEVGTIK